MAINLKDSSLDNMNIEQYKTQCLNAINNKDFNTATKYFKEYIELIVFNLLISDHFFGTFITHMEREVKYNFPAPAGVYIKKGSPSVVLNPILLFEYSHKEVKAILIHEVYHLLHFHLLRSKENNNRYDSHIENIAMDVAINQFIPDIPEDCITFKNFCDMYKLNPYDVKREETFEYYLDLIINSKAGQKESEEYKQMMKMLGDVLSELANGEDSNKEGEGKEGEGKDNGNGKSITDRINEILDKKYPVDHSIWKDSDNSDIQNIKDVVKQLANECIKECGNVPGHIQGLVDKMNQPAIIKWQDELKMLVGSVKCPYKKTILRRSRRMPDRADVLGRLSDRKVKIAVAIDTSGSMGEKELKFIFSEIFNILKLVKFELTIIECDMEIQRVYKAKNDKDIDMQVKGLGGTRMTPIFKYLKEEMKNDKPDLLVIFTDGYIEDELDEKYRINSMTKLMWVLTGRKKELACRNPWTNKIKELNLDNK